MGRVGIVYLQQTGLIEPFQSMEPGELEISGFVFVGLEAWSSFNFAWSYP